jgi:hypothetical protein
LLVIFIFDMIAVQGFAGLSYTTVRRQTFRTSI